MSGYSVVVDEVSTVVSNDWSIVVTFLVIYFIISDEARTVGLVVTVTLVPVIMSTLN